MCGILGGWNKNSNFCDQDIKLALDDMDYRGPNGRFHLQFNIKNRSSLVLAHNRLSIIDLSDAGKQPMFSQNKRFVITFNGEIYNYKELRKELEKIGFWFDTESDTEVLVNAWQCWGEDCLSRLEGMFSFVVFDKEENRITCVRDPFGIKPFFYINNRDSFYFASEVGALIKLSNHQKKLCHQRAYDYLIYGDYDSGESTFFDGIKHLLPGSMLVLDLNTGKLLKKIKWHHFNLVEDNQLSFTQAAESVRNQFLENIRLHLRSDVPLGAALSGGLDSSAVVCGIRYLEPTAEINTFSYIANDTQLSEEKWIDYINNQTNAKSHKVFVSSDDLFNDLDDLILTQGEPFSSTSIHAQYKVFELAKKNNIIVTLDGQGADEMLAGYRGYPIERLRSLLDSKGLLPAVSFINNWRKWPGRSNSEALKFLLTSLAPAKTKKSLEKIFLTDTKPTWLNNDYFQDNETTFNSRLFNEKSNFHGRNVIERMAYSLEVAGLPQLLRHADRNSMKFSIESRVPFLTSPMAKVCLRLPESYLISSAGETKSVFREAMRGIVPKKILNRRDKIGFLTPESKLFESKKLEIRKVIEDGISLPIFNENLLRNFDIAIKKKAFTKENWRQFNFIKWYQLNDL